MTIIETLEGEDATEAPKQVFASLADFVEQLVAPMISRDSTTMRWSPRWFDFPEVVNRLLGLWIDYEATVAEGQTLTMWWLHRFDPTMAVICSVHGPMRLCRGGLHEVADHLVVEPAPTDHAVRVPFAALGPTGEDEQ
ncbi:DUF4913 domain-containing protein [Lolliginicoccus levis]|uniref:DUF4913 domain-containing protein n=1 Tax=Lolliginicoccus levis TaxID=2919542 RepID=UPI00241CC48E|nr:DUF4913 domain-containing protein [Lolliginicoccus levis]